MIKEINAFIDAHKELINLYLKYDSIIHSKNDPRMKMLKEIEDIIIRCKNKTGELKK